MTPTLEQIARETARDVRRYVPPCGIYTEEERDNMLAAFIMDRFVALQTATAQRPEKPDHWTPCGQCERNAEDAADALDAYRSTHPKNQH